MTDFAPLSAARRWALGSGDKPPASLGRFELKTQLGRGAQATVWLAVDPRLQREVAIKLMRPLQDQDPSVLEPWLREARHVGRLAHPNIVSVFEADVQGLQPYIVFEYVPGRTLAAHLAQQGRCTPHDAVAFMLEVLDGLQAAHQAGIVHRDLKPSNIMVDVHRHARVMDFGLAAPVQGASDPQQISGTPAYMAPEAAEGAAPDQAPDEDGAAHGAQGLPRPVRRLPGHVPQRARAPRGGPAHARALLNHGHPMNGHAPHFEVEDFADPAAALARVHEIYDLAVDHLRRGLQHYVDGADIGRHVRACYPLLRVRTDVLDLRVDLRGGNLVGAELLQYPVDKDEPARKVRLFDSDAARFSVAQSGLVATAGNAPNHEAVFRPEGGRTDFQLVDGQDRLEIPLLWTDPATGLTVRKTWVLERGEYALTLREEIRNDGAAAWRGYGYQQLQRVPPVGDSKGWALTNPEAYSFTGGAWYSPSEKFEKRKYDDFTEDGPLNLDVTGGWIALLQHHFLVAWVPAKAEPQRFSLAALGNGQPRYLVRSVGAPFEVAPGTAATREATLWVGPKLQEQLQEVAPGLKLTLDYGIFTFLAQPMFDYVLKPLHDLTGNWGWAIILTVLAIKLALYWLGPCGRRGW